MRRLVSVLIMGLLGSAPGLAGAWEGFGAGVQLGTTSVYWVTHLGDSGPGSLRDAVSQCCRTVKFTVAGLIVPSSEIRVRGARIHIDGTSAPPPGITLWGRGLLIRGTEGANNVIVTAIRVQNAAIDAFHVGYGAFNVVLDRVAGIEPLDGAVDVTDGAYNVTVSHSLLIADKPMLIKYGNARRVSILRNILVGNQRLPQVSATGMLTLGDVHADIRNNIIVEIAPPTLHGTLVWDGGRANVIGNLYIGPRARDAVQVVAPGVAHVAGNQMFAGPGDPNAFSTSGPFLVSPLPATFTACAGAGIAITAGMPQGWNQREREWEAWVLGVYIPSLPPGLPC